MTDDPLARPVWSALTTGWSHLASGHAGEDGGSVRADGRRQHPAGARTNFAIVPLGEGDAAEMFALARLTVPGPYEALTHQLGAFIGVNVDGQLVAMAGERMAMPGFREVSGVCTHSDHRGRGYGGALMRAVARRMLARGETPFLHAYASNIGAIALYESLGFHIRRTVTATILVRDINI